MSLILDAYISLGVQFFVSLFDGLTSIPSLSTTPSWSKTTREFNRACACTRHILDPTTLPETEPARAQLRTARVMLNVTVGWAVLLPAFFLTTNFSDSIFGDVLGALQMLARAAHPT
jgi:hypothetical protein